MFKIEEAWSALKSLGICQLCLASIFITSGTVISIIQGLFYITIRVLNPNLYRRLNYYLTYMLNSQIVFLVEYWSGSKVILHCDPNLIKEYLGKEHALCLLNHGCEVDWLIGWVAHERAKVLGNAKVYLKRMLQYAPVIGWSWKFQEMIFLSRNWSQDKKNLARQISTLVSYPHPIWLTLFAEGTRFTQEKYCASMKVAKAKGLPLLKHHLLPRTKGFVASIPHLRGNVPAIYDVVIAVDKECKNEPCVYNLLKGRQLRVQLLVRRIPMSEVPFDDKEAAAWLQALYQQKDKMLHNYITNGSFVPEEQKEMEEYLEYVNYKSIEQPRRIYSLINVIFWTIFTLVPLGRFLLQTALEGSFIRISILSFSCFAAFQGFTFLVNLTKISKSSDYGKHKDGGEDINGNI